MAASIDLSLAAVARRPRTWLLLAGAWTLPALATAAALFPRLAANDPSASWWKAFWPQLFYWYPWILITPLVAGLAARMPLTRGRLAIGIGTHAVVAWSIGFLFQLYSMGFEMALLGDGLDLGSMLSAPNLGRAAASAVLSFGIYAMVLAVTEAWLGYRRLAAQSKALTEARLAALQAQLRPHFLFNTLHGIAALTESDPPAARAMTAKLASLLRQVIDEPSGALVPLSAELQNLDRYLDIERLRFADRLHIVRAIADDAADVLVPALILQPLAENAIRHGIEQKIDAGALHLTARRDGPWLVFDLLDDGPGPRIDDPFEPPREAGGIGLANVRQRLAAIYGDRASLSLEPGTAGGCRARLVLPVDQGVTGP